MNGHNLADDHLLAVDDLDGNPDEKYYHIITNELVFFFLPEDHHPLDGILVDIDGRGDIVESVLLHYAALTYMLPKNY